MSDYRILILKANNELAGSGDLDETGIGWDTEPDTNAVIVLHQAVLSELASRASRGWS